MISRAVAVPDIFHPRREIRQLISRAETVPDLQDDHSLLQADNLCGIDPYSRKLACHAFDTKWHIQLFGPSPPPLETCTGVPRLDVHVVHPYWCVSFKLGVPRLGRQVARASVGLGLACHAFDTKWHAQVLFPSGMQRPQVQVARPWCMMVFFWLKLRELSKNLILAEKGLLMLLDSDLPALKVDFMELQNSKRRASNCVGK
ncbi:hypothetical protein AHAS_Ahas11G0204100 [Arachis hypogaea]